MGSPVFRSNRPLYLGRTGSSELVAHPDNSVTAHPPGFADQAGLDSHPAPEQFMAQNPGLAQSLGPAFEAATPMPMYQDLNERPPERLGSGWDGPPQEHTLAERAQALGHLAAQSDIAQRFAGVGQAALAAPGQALQYAKDMGGALAGGFMSADSTADRSTPSQQDAMQKHPVAAAVGGAFGALGAGAAKLAGQTSDPSFNAVLMGSTPAGEDLVRMPTGELLVRPAGWARRNDLGVHPDAASYLQTNHPRMVGIVTPASGKAVVSDKSQFEDSVRGAMGGNGVVRRPDLEREADAKKAEFNDTIGSK